MKFKKTLRGLLSFLLLITMSVSLFTGCAQEDVELAADVLTAVLETQQEEETPTEEDVPVYENEAACIEDFSELQEDGTYTSKEDVSAYLEIYGHLPSNFITKKEAKKMGWISNEGNLGEVAPGMSIGGDYFGNYEGLLPEADGRDYYECDIDFNGTYRNSKRIVFSNDGLIYYTEDHYESFELLYGEE